MASHLRYVLLAFATASVAVAVACSSSSPDTGSADSDAGGGAASDAPSSSDAPASDAGPGLDSSLPLQSVTFSYTPSWKGVKKVEVLGAFGQATDWKQAFVTLTDDGTGKFTGTGAGVATGSYPYIFRVTGDEAAAAAKAATYLRYAIDPSVSAFAACPMGAPTFSAAAPNPCSTLTVPQGSPELTFHARGVVQSSGAPIGGYLVEIEREEPASHHMFADRTTTKADGTFDLAVVTGTYRFQVLHPSFLAMTDAERTSPETLAAVRRTISSATMIKADRTFNAAEVAFDGYAAMEPRGAAVLPTTFTFAVPAGRTVRAAVYGPGNTIGDPWWVAPLGVATSDEFDGGFNTAQAADGGLKPDAGYSWGTEELQPTPDGGGVSWTAQSMVFPIKWQ